VEVRISAQNLLHNLRQFQTLYAPCTIAPVLKSNAYGHGLVEVARIMDQAGVSFLVVDGYYEALILRNEGIRADILVIGYSATENIVRCRLSRVAFMVGDMTQLVELSRHLVRPQCIHLKVDTGMRRYGLLCSDLKDAFQIVRDCSTLRVEGVFSHLATARSGDDTFLKEQIRLWNDVAAQARQSIPTSLHLHLLNTSGSYYADRADATVMRLGLGLYGMLNSSRRDMELWPALSVVSRACMVKTLAKGEGIGYGLTYRAERDISVVIVPTGYNACVDRRLSNRGIFRIRGVNCPIIGKVNMNVTCIDARDVEDIGPAEEIEVISAQKDAMNSVQHIARLCDTTPYVILTGISPHLRRVVIA